jgi:hypothetical protein
VNKALRFDHYLKQIIDLTPTIAGHYVQRLQKQTVKIILRFFASL